MSVQKSVRFERVSDIPVVMTKLRGALPTVLEGVTVTSAEEIDKDIIRLRLADGTRVMVRPSGTEPKIKCYVDAVGMEGTAAERSATARAASSRAANAMAEVLIKLS